MPEIRTVKFGFLADTVDAEGYLAAGGLLERQAHASVCNTSEPKFMLMDTTWLVL